jgi:cbb3-type cytochrome oxidase maturation protein
MYLSYWGLLVIFSVVSSIIAFLWGHRSGQFTDQKRASYLALNEEYINTASIMKPRGFKKERRFLGIIFGIIFTVMIISCLITLIMVV